MWPAQMAGLWLRSIAAMGVAQRAFRRVFQTILKILPCHNSRAIAAHCSNNDIVWTSVTACNVLTPQVVVSSAYNCAFSLSMQESEPGNL
jgi:hypothetical protein